MHIIQQLRYISLLLISIISLQSCTSQTTPDKQGWLFSLNEAQTQSVKENKPILVYFTASDTCGTCKRMDAEVFSTPTFKDWAEKSVVLLKVDFSNLPEGSKEQNTGMAQSLKVTTYPTIWILNITHEPQNNRFKVKPMGMIGYQDTPEKFIGMLQGLTRTK